MEESSSSEELSESASTLTGTSITMTSNETDVRDAAEVFIHMHRCFRASRNVRAHWFLDHLNKKVSVPSPGATTERDMNDRYQKEIEVCGVTPKDASDNETFEGQQFKVTLDTKVTYLSRFYRHVFILDLSPSTIVADDQADSCLHEKLLDSLRLAVSAVTKSFKIPGTNHTFSPQIYVSVCVFTPFLGFDEELVLVQRELLTESNAGRLLDLVEKRFRTLVSKLHKYSQPILERWSNKRRRARCKYDSTCEGGRRGPSESESRAPPKITVRKLAEGDHKCCHAIPNVPSERALGLVHTPRGVWKTDETEGGHCDDECDSLCDGYVQPEWALIFMLRLGLIAVQMLPENTQSNIVVLTDCVCGMPDGVALHQVLSQLRTYTVSCSFLQIIGSNRSDPCFGHVASSELFHFISMATFGSFIPNCRCVTSDLEGIFVRRDSEKSPGIVSIRDSSTDEHSTTGSSRNYSGGSVGPGRRVSEEAADVPSAGAQPVKMNPFHRALLCWCFQNALRDNAHIENMINDINPAFSKMCTTDSMRHTYLNMNYLTSVQELLYVRLREGYTLKNAQLMNRDTRIRIHLSLPFRPLVYIDYIITGSWPLWRASRAKDDQREQVNIRIEVMAPSNVMKDLLSEDGDFVNITIHKGNKVFRSALDTLIEADRLLMHLHKFNVSAKYYHVPFGISIRRALFGVTQLGEIASVVPCPDLVQQEFLDFWRVLCSLDEGIWQKWVHTHCERLILAVDQVPQNIFGVSARAMVDCSRAQVALHKLLRRITTFCLLEGSSYVKFVYNEDAYHSHKPRYFYFIRVCLSPPCVALKVAFVGGITSAERKKITDTLRSQLIELRIARLPPPALPTIRKRQESRRTVQICVADDDVKMLKPGETVSHEIDPSSPLQGKYSLVPSQAEVKDQEALFVIRRPVERVLVRYHSVPDNLHAIVRLREDAMKGVETIKDLTLHNALSKYMICRRRIWNLPCAFVNYILPPNKEFARFVLFVLLHRRLNDRPVPFHIAWADSGIVNVCRQLAGTSGKLLEQYVFFPPQRLNIPLKVERQRLPPSMSINIADEDDHGIVFEDDELRNSVCVDEGEESEDDGGMYSDGEENEEQAYQIIAEHWCEPQGVEEDGQTEEQGELEDDKKGSERAPKSHRDDFVIQVLYTLDQLLRWCKGRPNSNISISDTTCEEATPISHCVSVVVQPFNLRGLVEQSEKRLLVMPLYEIDLKKVDRMRVGKLFDSYKREFNQLSQCYLDVEDPTLWNKIVGKVLQPPKSSESAVPARISGGCRIYLDRLTPWNLIMLIIPLSVEDVIAYRGIPILFCLCDEPTLADDLANCRHPIELSVDDRRIRKQFFERDLANEECKKRVAQQQFVWVTRPPARTPVGYDVPYLDEYVDNIVEVACGRAIVWAIYNNILDGIDVDGETIQAALEDYCGYLRVEITRVEEALKQFCHHLREPSSPDASTQATTSHLKKHWCDGADHETVFDSSVEQNFFPVPSCPTYFVYRNDHQRLTEKEVDVYKLPLFFDHPSSVVNNDRDLLRNALPSHEGVGERVKRAEVPVFISFMLSVTFPNGQLEAFHIRHLPYCVSECVELCRNKPPGHIDLSKVKVRMEVYVHSWHNRPMDPELWGLLDARKFAITREEQERDMSEEKIRMREFREDMPVEEGVIIGKLLKSIDRIIEMELTLTESRQHDEVTLKDLQNISKFIMKQLKENGVDRRIGEKVRRKTQFVIEDAHIEEEFKSRLDGLEVENCVLRRVEHSEMFYCCPVDVSQRCRDKDGVVNLRAQCESPFRQHEPADFWIILRVLPDELHMLMCRRNMHRHEKLFDSMWGRVRMTLRVLNQEKLLEAAFTSRYVDPLLFVPDENDQDSFRITSPMDGLPADSDTEIERPISFKAKSSYRAGDFACDVLAYKWLPIHPRILRDRRQTGNAGVCVGVLPSGIETLSRALAPFQAKNIPNFYLLREPDGNVLYVLLHLTEESVYALFDGVHGRICREAGLRKVEVAKNMKKRMILFTFHAARPPSPIFLAKFVEEIQKRLNTNTLDHLIDVFSKNRHAGRLEIQDAQFIQRNPQVPTAHYFLKLPLPMSRILSALTFYVYQLMEVYDLPEATVKEESGSGNRPKVGSEIRTKRGFEPYRTTEVELDGEYVPRFFLHVTQPQRGKRESGLALVELRFVGYDKQIAALSDGRLDQGTHNVFLDALRNHREAITKVEEVPNFKKRDKAGVFAEVCIWEAGEVGLEKLRHKIHTLITQACVDVVTEFGLLNGRPIEVQQLPVANSTNWGIRTSSGVHQPTKPAAFRARSTSDAPMRRRNLFLEAPPSLPSAMLLDIPLKHGSAHFSFERTRTMTEGNELQKDKEKEKETAQEENETVKPNSRELLNDNLAVNARRWFLFLAKKFGKRTPSLRTFRFQLESIDTGTRAMESVANVVEAVLDNDNGERVVVATRGTSRDGRYEIIDKNLINVPLTSDLPVELIKKEEDMVAPRVVLFAFLPAVAEETLRYGLDPEGEPPELLLHLATQAPTMRFLPNLTPFVPRQRVVFIAAGDKSLDVFMYNVQPRLCSQLGVALRNLLRRHNARSALLREIALQKCGITHVQHSRVKESRNPLLVNIWRDVEELQRADPIPGEMPVQEEPSPVYDMNEIFNQYAHYLVKSYRFASPGFLSRNVFRCLWEEQLFQLVQLRKDLLQMLNGDLDMRMAHKALITKTVPKSKLESLVEMYKRVHFVKTPILFFEEWRRKVARVRKPGVDLCAAEEARKKLIAEERAAAIKASSNSSSTFRARSDTFSLPSSRPPLSPSPAATPQHQQVFNIEIPRPKWHIQILYTAVSEYVEYLKKKHHLHLLKILGVPRYEMYRYSPEVPTQEGLNLLPEIWMCRVMPCGVLLVHLSFIEPFFTLDVISWPATSIPMNIQDHVKNDELRRRELRREQRKLIAGCHLHSFVYDFHLRLIYSYLVDRDKKFFSVGYGTNAFLSDFLKYYQCRPPSSANCIIEERISYPLRHGVSALAVWEYLLNQGDKGNKWDVLRMNPDPTIRFDEYLIISNTTDQKGQTTVRLVIFDMERAKVFKAENLNRKNDCIFITVYLIHMARNQHNSKSLEKKKEEAAKKAEAEKMQQVDIREIRKVEQDDDTETLKADDDSVDTGIEATEDGVPALDDIPITRPLMEEGVKIEETSTYVVRQITLKNGEHRPAEYFDYYDDPNYVSPFEDSMKRHANRNYYDSEADATALRNLAPWTRRRQNSALREMGFCHVSSSTVSQDSAKGHSSEDDEDKENTSRDKKEDDTVNDGDVDGGASDKERDDDTDDEDYCSAEELSKEMDEDDDDPRRRHVSDGGSDEVKGGMRRRHSSGGGVETLSPGMMTLQQSETNTPDVEEDSAEESDDSEPPALADPLIPEEEVAEEAEEIDEVCTGEEEEQVIEPSLINFLGKFDQVFELDKSDSDRSGESTPVPPNQRTIIKQNNQKQQQKQPDEVVHIPEESVTYVHIYTPKQKRMQRRIQNAAIQYAEDIRQAVEEAESVCRLLQLWRKIVQLPQRSTVEQKNAIETFLKSTSKSIYYSNPWKPMLYALHPGAQWTDLDLLCKLASRERMDTKEPLLKGILDTADHVRLCRFLLARYGPQQCRYFELPKKNKRAVVITIPNYMDSLFLVTFELGHEPVIEVLFREAKVPMRSSFNCHCVDQAFDQMVRLIFAFEWSEVATNWTRFIHL